LRVAGGSQYQARARISCGVDQTKKQRADESL